MLLQSNIGENTHGNYATWIVYAEIARGQRKMKFFCLG